MGGTATNDSQASSFTIETLAKLLEQFKCQRFLVGIVCRPDTLRQLRSNLTVTAPDGVFPNKFFDVPLYEDCKQFESWKPFYDADELRAYLNRNEPKTEKED